MTIKRENAYQVGIRVSTAYGLHSRRLINVSWRHHHHHYIVTGPRVKASPNPTMPVLKVLANFITGSTR